MSLLANTVVRCVVRQWRISCRDSFGISIDSGGGRTEILYFDYIVEFYLFGPQT